MVTMTMDKQSRQQAGKIWGARMWHNLNIIKFILFTLSLQADVPLNDGVLLPIDIIATNEIKAEAILGIPPGLWFGSDMREHLTKEEVHKLAVRGGETRDIAVTIGHGIGRIIVYADYENTSGREGQQLIISPRKSWFSKNYLISVRNNRLELMP
jgi:hypothetical protein